MDYDQELNTLEWENTDEKGITSELEDFNKTCSEVTKLLKTMIPNNECKKTETAMESFAYSYLGAAGWISEFRMTNQDAFSKYVNGSARPSWYSSLSLEKQKKYDMILKYYKDMTYLQISCIDLNRILLELVDRQNLREGFRLVFMKSNFEDGGINENTFKTAETDARQVSARINRNWGDTEGIARSAAQFLEANRDRMEYNTLKTGYQKARLKDYLDDFRSSAISSSFGVQSDGTFYVNAGILSKVRMIDRYTFKIAQMEAIEDVMKKLMEDCSNVLNKQLIPHEKNALTEAGGNAFYMLRYLVNELITFAQTVLEEFKLYKEADPGKAPYCFMKLLSAYDSIQSRYALNPSRKNPWDSGTELADLYVMEAVSLTRHCEDFVRKQGNVNFRD